MLPAPPPAYVIEARLDPVRHEVDATMTLRYANRGVCALDEVWLQLYPNTFKPGSDYLRESGKRFNLDSFFPYGRDAGWLAVRDARVAGLAVATKEEGAFMKVVLPRSLAPGETVELTMGFTTHIAQVYDRCGRVGDDYTLGYWYPRVAPRGPAGWDLTPRSTPVQEFHDEHADFDVAMALPAGWGVGATGHRLADTLDGDGRHVRFEAASVRGFCLVTSPDLRAIESERDGVTVHVLARAEEAWIAPRILDQTHAMVRYYGELVGPYPYRDLTIASSEALPIGGIEMPQMVLNSRILTRLADLARGRVDVGYAALNSHEVAHQWFYGLIGNDEAHDAWLDESFASYLSRRFLERPGPVAATRLQQFGEELSWLNRYVPFASPRASQYRAALRQQLAGLAVPLTSPLVELPLGQVSPTYYARGPVVIEMLRRELGEPAFSAFLHALYADWRFRTLDTAGVQAAAERVAGRSLALFFDTWVRGAAGTLDYALVGWQQQPLPGGRVRATARVKQLGNTDLPAPVAFYLADGRQVTAQYRPGAGTASVEATGRVVGVVIDLERGALDSNYGNNGRVPRAGLRGLDDVVDPQRGMRLGGRGNQLSLGADPVGANPTLNLDLSSIRSANRGFSLGWQRGEPVWSLGFNQSIMGLGNYDSRWAASFAKRLEGYVGGLELGLALQPRVGENPTYGLLLGAERRAFAGDPSGAPAGATNVARLDLLVETRRVLYGVRPAGGRYRFGIEGAPLVLDTATSFVTPSLEAIHHFDLGWATTLSTRAFVASTLGHRDPRDELRLEREGLFRTVGLGAGESLAALNLELGVPLSKAIYAPILPVPFMLNGLAFADMGWAGTPIGEVGVGLRWGLLSIGQASVGFDWAPYNSLEGWSPTTVQFRGGYGF